MIETGQVVSLRQVAFNIVELSMKLPGIAELYQGPGQFIALLPARSWENPLRRPMSIASVAGDNVSIIFKIVGQGTRKLSRLRAGDQVDVLGPLGNTFDLSPDKKPVLVGGGVGLAPLLNIYDLFTDRNLSPILVLGARSENEHFIKHEPENNTWLTTDDGSVGLQGNVMAALKQIHDSIEEDYKIYGCGPEPMLKAIQRFSKDNNIDAELSVESYMGCGIGICQGCVIENSKEQTKEHSYHEKFSLVCTQGPVFNSQEVKFG